MVKNAILHQQVIVLNRQVEWLQLTTGDCLRFVFLIRLIEFWKSVLLYVQPQTLLRWHRDLFRRYWKRIPKPKKRKLRIPQETIDIIKEMAQENWLWGAEKN